MSTLLDYNPILPLAWVMRLRRNPRRARFYGIRLGCSVKLTQRICCHSSWRDSDGSLPILAVVDYAI
jgi:hypothetical protein